MKPTYKGTILSVTAKCSDLWSHEVRNNKGTISEYHGYVPSFMPGEHYGDYVMLDIDPYTGRILNWKPWTKAGHQPRSNNGRFVSRRSK